MLGVQRSSYGCTWEVGRAQEKRLSASLASWVLSQLPKCIHNSIDAQLKHGPFLLEHWHFKRKRMKYRVLLNDSERFDWLNAITRFNRPTGVRLSRFRCTLAPYKKRAKNCQLCSNISYTPLFWYLERTLCYSNFVIHGLLISALGRK